MNIGKPRRSNLLFPAHCVCADNDKNGFRIIDFKYSLELNLTF